MLSYHFLIKNQLNYDDALSDDTKNNLDNGRMYLINGEFKAAIYYFDQIIKNAKSNSTLSGWSQLLSYFTHAMQKEFIRDCANLYTENDPITAFFINVLKKFAQKSLIIAEYDDFENVQRYFRQLIIIKTEANEKLDFTELHHYAWSLRYINNMITAEKIAEANQAIKSLEKKSKNHLLYFLKFLVLREDPNLLATSENFSRVVQMLSEAIRTCPHSIHASGRLSMYYLRRGNMKLLQLNSLAKQSKAIEQKRLEIISDYQDSLKLDSPENNELDYESRIEKLTAIQKAYAFSPSTKKTTKLSQLIKQNVKVEYFVARAKAYVDQQDKALASLDYLSAIWLIRLQMDTSSKYSQHDLEKQLASLSITEEKTLPEKKPIESAKPHKKREPLLAQQKTEQEKLEQDKLEQEKLDQERIIKEAKAAEERQQAENHKKSEKEKQKVKAVLTNLVNQVVLNAELELKSQETIARRKEKKALKKLARQKRKEIEAPNANPIQETHPAEIESEIKPEEKLEENYWKQELIPYYPITHIEVPPLVIETGQRIKSLPGCLAKRTYIYGGTARDAALRLKRNKFDFDIRTGLSLPDVAPLLKSVFKLEAEPEIKFNLLTVNFVVNTAEGAQKAVLTVHHSEHLAKAELSYLEILRTDALTLDFIQNVFIATFPRTGSRCAVHYPLNWWQFYLAPTLNEAEENVKRSKAKEQLSESLTTITNPPFLLIANNNTLKAYLFIDGVKHCFDLKLKESDRDLLVTNKEGRLIVTTQNQHLVLKFLKQLNKQYNKIYPQKKLHDLTKNIVAKISQLKKMETILEPSLSLSIDPLRILRLIYLTTSLNCEGFSNSMIAAAFNNQDSYKKFLLDNPARVNSWMNKLFCREGKSHMIENFNHLIHLRLLDISFPGLTEALNIKMLFQWFNHEFCKAKQLERPSLNYLYCVLIHCLSLHTKTPPEHIIEATPLLKENFKSMPLDLLRSVKQSWYAAQHNLNQVDFFSGSAICNSQPCPKSVHQQTASSEVKLR